MEKQTHVKDRQVTLSCSEEEDKTPFKPKEPLDKDKKRQWKVVNQKNLLRESDCKTGKGNNLHTKAKSIAWWELQLKTL